MIPKILHRIWLGGAPLPARFQHFGARLAGLHPDWDIRLWTDDTLPALINQREFDAAPHKGWAANILRYELLLQFGGIYLDTDMQPANSMEPLLTHSAFVAEHTPGALCNAAMGGEPGNLLFERLTTNLSERVRARPGMPSPLVTGSVYLADTVRELRQEGHPITVLEKAAFFPFSLAQKPILEIASPTPAPQSYAIHHWMHSWTKS